MVSAVVSNHDDRSLTHHGRQRQRPKRLKNRHSPHQQPASVALRGRDHPHRARSRAGTRYWRIRPGRHPRTGREQRLAGNSFPYRGSHPHAYGGEDSGPRVAAGPQGANPAGTGNRPASSLDRTQRDQPRERGEQRRIAAMTHQSPSPPRSRTGSPERCAGHRQLGTIPAGTRSRAERSRCGT